MVGLIIFIHILICVLLACAILMQAGRGGGLTENFAAAESMFGAKTNTVMVKATTILASIFLVTCMSLAFFSFQKDKSLMSDKVAGQSLPAGQAGLPADRPSAEQAGLPAVDANTSTNPQ